MARQSEPRAGLPNDARSERRAAARYPLDLEVRYSGSGRHGLRVTGSGRTIDLGSSGIAFTADKPLPRGLKLDLSIDWPVLLDGGVQLQLTMSGVIVRAGGTVTALRIQRHEFKTRRMSLTVLPPERSAS
jgi:hypothetical protein